MTKKYKVFGIGNALVDMEFEVSESFLNDNKVEKGLMTLVERERQVELLNSLDGIQHKRSCGGSAANTIIAGAQLGANNYYSCKVASDETGEFYYKDMKEIGVHSNIENARFEVDGPYHSRCRSYDEYVLRNYFYIFKRGNYS